MRASHGKLENIRSTLIESFCAPPPSSPLWRSAAYGRDLKTWNRLQYLDESDLVPPPEEIFDGPHPFHRVVVCLAMASTCSVLSCSVTTGEGGGEGELAFGSKASQIGIFLSLFPQWDTVTRRYIARNRFGNTNTSCEIPCAPREGRVVSRSPRVIPVVGHAYPPPPLHIPNLCMTI